jgi:proline-specific peptidase
VIFYDQIGCGRSDRPVDPAFFTVQTFVDELDALRAELGLERVHVLGQSWGGMLAMEYALRKPAGLASIVVADSPASMTLWVSEANRLRAELPPEIERTLREHEDAGTTTDPAYEAAVAVFYERHVCRLDPWPDCFARTAESLAHDGFVYNLMNGPSEFHCIGTLKTWDITDRLHEIRTPTLLLSGRYDEATPLIVSTIHERIPGSEWIVFEESSHTPHLEEPAAFNAAVRAFLAGVESTRLSS